MSEQAEALTLQRRVCIGDRLIGKRKVQAWLSLGENDKLPENTDQWSYWKTAIKGGAPGAVYEFTLDEKGSTWLKGERAPKYLRMFGDKTLVEQWKIRHAAANAASRAASRERREKNAGKWREALAPLRHAYVRSSAAERAALLALFCRYIVEGK